MRDAPFVCSTGASTSATCPSTRTTRSAPAPQALRPARPRLRAAGSHHQQGSRRLRLWRLPTVRAAWRLVLRGLRVGDAFLDAAWQLQCMSKTNESMRLPADAVIDCIVTKAEEDLLRVYVHFVCAINYGLQFLNKTTERERLCGSMMCRKYVSHAAHSTVYDPECRSRHDGVSLAS